jgi:hypothetical protein
MAWQKEFDCKFVIIIDILFRVYLKFVLLTFTMFIKIHCVKFFTLDGVQTKSDTGFFRTNSWIIFTVKIHLFYLF